MSDPREIQALLQRTHPDSVGPAYNRPPAAAPPTPAACVETMWARVVDGTQFGKPFRYKHTAPFNAIVGWYVVEACPLTYAWLYPSRTHDGPNYWNDWIETVAYNQCYAYGPTTVLGGFYSYSLFWPIPIGSIVQLRKYIDGFGDPYWLTWQPPVACMAIVSGVNADGSVDGAEWSDYQGNGWGMEVAVQPRLPTYTNGPAGGVWYPYAQLGDRLILVPLGYEYPVSPPTGERRCIMWHDMTPRIQLDANTKSGGDPPPHERDVYVDFSGGSGQPWHLDQDT